MGAPHLGMLRGIERGVGIDESGYLATDSHPEALGSALMHLRITTDYRRPCSSLLPGNNNVEQLLNGLIRNPRLQRAPFKWPASVACEHALLCEGRETDPRCPLWFIKYRYDETFVS